MKSRDIVLAVILNQRYHNLSAQPEKKVRNTGYGDAQRHIGTKYALHKARRVCKNCL